jgi:para-nitrobenzyl esterase
VLASDYNAVVETTAGKIRGFSRSGIHTFKGVPYAGPTAGSARFMPPAKPVPWTGVRSSMAYGFVCPQEPRRGWARDELAWLFDWDDGRPGEDCLHLNIWTPGLNDGRKRPVMVWLHGGGYTAGSSQEQPGYNGENLSRRGDVVVVSLNHRIGVLGFLNLAEFGEKYASSANVGMLDVVSALEWVRDNVASFGGDPGNVTIFGQSGGGGKVGVIMAMPAAEGLFHKAVVQSGSLMRQLTPDQSTRLTAAVLAELQLNGSQSSSQSDRLLELPVERLVAAGVAAVKKVAPKIPPEKASILDWIGWQPTVDGKILPVHSFDPVAPAISADVPLMIGSCLNEFTMSILNPKLESLTDEELQARVAGKYGGGENSAHIIEVFRRGHPGATPVVLWELITNDFRRLAVTQARRKAAQNAAPAYLYSFAWRSPVLDGRFRSFHCLDIPFVFYNTDVHASMTGGGADARELSTKVSNAWINFARSGNPNHNGIPKWPAFEPNHGATMIFDKVCEARDAPDSEEMRVMVES